MECFGGKKMSNHYERSIRQRGLTEKISLIQEEMREIRHEREKERKGYERDMMVFAFKEAEWNQEKKKLKEEVKRLTRMVEEKDGKIREMEYYKGFDFVGEKDCQILGAPSFLVVEQMREERALRDEAVDKWKKLYLAIKMELDDLIQRTHQDGLYWRAEEEEMIEELKMEVKAKEETIEELKERLGIVENEGYKRAREVDILRQSLRIMSSRKGINPSFLEKQKQNKVISFKT